MELHCTPYFDLISNEVCQMIFDFVKIDKLKILRLVGRRVHGNATKILQFQLCPMTIELENKEDIDKFTNVMSKSSNVPFSHLKLKIFINSCPIESIERFLRNFGDYIVECSVFLERRNHDLVNNYKSSTGGLEESIHDKLKLLFQKTNKLIQVEFEELGQFPTYYGPLEIPKQVETITIWNRHNNFNHYHLVIPQKLSILSSLIVPSTSTLELHCVCVMCLSNILVESLGKGYKQVSLPQFLDIDEHTISYFSKISKITNPSLAICILRLNVTNGCNMEFWNSLNRILISNSDYLQVFELVAGKCKHDVSGFLIPKLDNLTQLNLKKYSYGPPFKFIINAENLQHLQSLRLNFHQVDAFCPLHTTGIFGTLSCLTLNASLLSFQSCQLWIPSFSNITTLKIAIPFSASTTSVSQDFCIPAKNLNKLRHVKINFEFFCEKNLDVKQEWKRWIGLEQTEESHVTDMTSNNNAKGSIGLCDLTQLSSLKISGVGVVLYSLWIDMLMFMTRTKQLKRLDYVMVKPSSHIEVNVYKLPEESYYNALRSYHGRVEILHLTNHDSQ